MRDFPPSSAPGGAVGVMHALNGHPSLQSLAQTLQRSNQRLQAVRPCMAAALWQSLKAGPASDTHWVILTAQASVAARLKWLTPSLEAKLLETEGRAVAVEIRVFAG